MGAIGSLAMGYRAFMKFIRWNLRLATSTTAGLMPAMLFCLGGARLGGSRDEVTAVLLVLALPLWIVVSVISYRILKPKPQNRESRSGF
jgi:Na+/H+-dicarboxylate symporter